MQQMGFYCKIFIVCSTCFGHYYAHHHELKSIMCPVCGMYPANRTQPTAPHQTDNLKTKVLSTTVSNHQFNTRELLMMGIIVPETC